MSVLSRSTVLHGSVHKPWSHAQSGAGTERRHTGWTGPPAGTTGLCPGTGGGSCQGGQAAWGEACGRGRVWHLRDVEEPGSQPQSPEPCAESTLHPIQTLSRESERAGSFEAPRDPSSLNTRSNVSEHVGSHPVPPGRSRG